MKYSFGDVNIDINCNSEYAEFFNMHLDTCLSDEKSKIFLKCHQNAKIKLNRKKMIINSISMSDMYFILFNSLANVINDNHNLLIHSSVITNEKDTILILGDFGSGKTTLVELAKKYNYKVLSTDQTWVRIIDNKLEIKYGSIYNRTRTGDKYKISKIDNYPFVSKIILVKAVLKGAHYNEKIYINNEQIKKRIAGCLFWSMYSPIGKKNVFLQLNIKKINNAVDKLLELNIPFKEVWGYKNILDKLLID